MTATTFTTRVLECDHHRSHRPCEGCSRTFRGEVGQKLPEVRRDARHQDGWSYIPGHPAATKQPAGRDLCAEHKPGGSS